MSKYLIIPDIHNRWKLAERIIAQFPKGYTVVFLGDYFDSFGDSPEVARETAEWLKDSLSKKDRIHLEGNHDSSYRYNFMYCSGYEVAKHQEIKKVLSALDWDKLKLFYKIPKTDFVLSHAGLHPFVFEHPVLGMDINDIQDKCNKAVDYAKCGVLSDVYAAGRSVGGRHPVGGITWLRWWDLKPITGLNQIVGHTAYNAPEIRYTLKEDAGAVIHQSVWGQSFEIPSKEELLSINYNLDTNSHHFMSVENGQVSIHLSLDFL